MAHALCQTLGTIILVNPYNIWKVKEHRVRNIKFFLSKYHTAFSGGCHSKLTPDSTVAIHSATQNLTLDCTPLVLSPSICLLLTAVRHSFYAQGGHTGVVTYSGQVTPPGYSLGWNEEFDQAGSPAAQLGLLQTTHTGIEQGKWAGRT